MSLKTLFSTMVQELSLLALLSLPPWRPRFIKWQEPLVQMLLTMRQFSPHVLPVIWLAFIWCYSLEKNEILRELALFSQEVKKGLITIFNLVHYHNWQPGHLEAVENNHVFKKIISNKTKQKNIKGLIELITW